MVKTCKKAFVLLLIVAMLLLPCSAFAIQMRVYDFARLFTSDEVMELENTIASATADTGYDFVVLTSNDVGGKSSIAYADDFYDENGFGTGEDFSGLLYFIDMDNRVPTISTCGEMIDIITDARLEKLLDTAFEYLVEGEYAASAEAVIEQAVSYAKRGVVEGQYRVDEETGQAITRPRLKLTFGEVLFALAAGTAVFFLLRVTLRANYTLRGNQVYYDPYTNGIVNVKKKEDRYIRSFTVTRPKPQPTVTYTSSSHSSHSPHRTSTVHRSSSGRSHGGGSGRKF